MKVAVSATGKSLDSAVDPRFGRCACFVIVDSESFQFEAFDNAHAALTGGAGIQAAQFVAAKGARALVTGRCGPNAVLALSAAGVERYEGQDRLTVREAIEKLKSGQLVASADAGSPLQRGLSQGAGRRVPAALSRAAAGAGRGGGAGMRRGRGGGGGGRGRARSS
jgi:predicted Fe-Mo cluster-binding NifX family protein